MFDIIRDSTVGQVVNHLSGGRLLPYADQLPGYQYPRRDGGLTATPSRDSLATRVPTRAPSVIGEKTEVDAKLEKGTVEPELAVETPIENPFLVYWDGPTDPDNPRQVLLAFSLRRSGYLYLS